VVPASLEQRTTCVDNLIRATAQRFLNTPSLPACCLAAVGGYGRSELFPQSDIDILVLVGHESATDALKEPLSDFLGALWDAGLRASQSVRTVSECCRLHENNIELHISLLDLRYVAGDRALFEQLSAALPPFYERHQGRLIRELAAMTRQRHSRFNQTVYHLEPNIKEAPGGIRDIHFLHWLALLTHEKGPLPEALTQVEEAKQFLYTLRCFLHQQAARDNNLLTFELQDRVAASGLWAESDPASWMRLYYRHARRVFESCRRALEFADLRDPSIARQFSDWRGRLSSADFTVSHDRIFLRNPSLTISSPENLLALFTFAARHGLPLSGDAQRRLRAEAPRLQSQLRQQRIPWPRWREFFEQPHVACALRQFEETDLLAATIPHWESIECLVVRDFYHRYTVDEHSIVAIEIIDRLAANRSGTQPAPEARFRDLLLEEETPAVLRLALLLHDVGKGTRPGDHVQGSLDASAAVLEHLSVPLVQQEQIRFLIAHHLDLSTVMTGRDLDDPATGRFLTARIPTPEDLRRLTLVTYADISAVNPTAMTPWRLEQLWRVYSAGLEQLTRELISDRIHGEHFAALEGASPELLDFLEGFPTRYLRTHSRDEIESHLALDRKRRQNGVAVRVTQDSGAYLLTVLASDQPGNFASLCGALSSHGMNILKAEASSNAHGSMLDLIRFSDPSRSLELNPGEVKRLEWSVESVLRGAMRVADLLKQKRPPRRLSSGAKILPSVHFTNEASDTCTLIDFVGEDRPGLLFDLASVLAARDCNIELVLVDTEAYKAMDVFYLTRHGAKLEEPFMLQLSDELVRAATPA
jgi:[protein-PII] uridylyltransferase